MLLSAMSQDVLGTAGPLINGDVTCNKVRGFILNNIQKSHSGDHVLDMLLFTLSRDILELLFSVPIKSRTAVPLKPGDVAAI